ncbi:MAG TPA: 3-alpha,7-alpha,12-alpha-trihydroxy-5-beta-cholest-24-enoyl-CoA hydratase [Rhodobiaceae bacterium]|nr:3-alpha,7-alpha,12-alpha-trihydroxy-5-beta-cholest-24-enoyl-CoA hydratase [Rhodobiaceae bacterium]
MAKRPISSDLVGLRFQPREFSWTEKDTILYALGVGARPENDLDFIYEGKGPKVLPTYSVIAGGVGLAGMMTEIEMRLEMLLHGEQSVELFRPLPPKATISVESRVSEVWDKEKAAVLGVESVGRDADGDLFKTHATLFVRGAGGFGGERGPSTAGKNVPPGRAPDLTVEDVTRPEQGAIYRLSGDRNPIHIDPDFAKLGGFERPFVHGLCTYGFVGRAALKTLCGNDPAKFRSLEGRFANQVYFGDTIVTKIWKTAPGEAVVQGETGEGNIVLSQARVTFAN